MKKHKQVFSNVLRFPVVFQEEHEGGFTVTVPSLPGCVTFGKNLSHAKKMIKEAIELYLEDASSEGESVHILNEATYLSEIVVELDKPVHV